MGRTLQHPDGKQARSPTHAGKPRTAAGRPLAQAQRQ
nr:MAG TPA: hypothetical protein [Caudoviricetes sp.]